MSDREKFEQWLVSTYPGAITTRCQDGYIGTVPHPVLRATYASVQMMWEAFRAGAQPAPGAEALLSAAKIALDEMRHTIAPRDSFTNAVDALDAAIAAHSAGNAQTGEDE